MMMMMKYELIEVVVEPCILLAILFFCPKNICHKT